MGRALGLLVAITGFAVMGCECGSTPGIRASHLKVMGPSRMQSLRGGGGGGGGEPDAGGRPIGERILESLEKAEASAAEYAKIDMAKLEEFASSMDIAKVNWLTQTRQRSRRRAVQHHHVSSGSCIRPTPFEQWTESLIASTIGQASIQDEIPASTEVRLCRGGEQLARSARGAVVHEWVAAGL